MSITFNADEIFGMAEEIERQGAKFYREAAANASGSEIREMLLAMALMEDGHLATFSQMRAKLSEDDKGGTAFDPDNEAALYLQAMADAHGTEGMKNSGEKLSGSEDVEQILRIALSAEKDSVVFYTGIRELLTAQSAKDKINAVIKEELKHITTLSDKLMSVI